MTNAASRLHDRLPAMATFALFLTLCGSAAYWATQLIHPADRRPQAAQASEDAGAELMAKATPPTQDLQLFGTASDAGGLDIALRGTFYAGRPEAGAALLKIGELPARAFHVGEEVAPGTRLQQVLADEVVLLRGTAMLRVSLPTPENKAAAAAIAGAQAGPDRAQERVPAMPSTALAEAAPATASTAASLTAAPSAAEQAVAEPAGSKRPAGERPPAGYELRYD